MKKNGFTLVELIAVLVILALIILIVTPKVLEYLNGSKEDAYTKQTKILEQTAEKWAVKNASKLSENAPYYLEIVTLSDEKFLSSSKIIDPRTNKKMEGCIVIKYDDEYRQFEYKYNENTCASLK
jgi:prepilin-type N-terminal cleavage/methylation domain